MTNIFNNFVQGYILGLSRSKFSFADIIKIYKENNISIFYKGIHSILHDKNIPDLFQSKAEKFTKKYHPAKFGTWGNISKVHIFLKKENQPN